MVRRYVVDSGTLACRANLVHGLCDRVMGDDDHHFLQRSYRRRLRAGYGANRFAYRRDVSRNDSRGSALGQAGRNAGEKTMHDLEHRALWTVSLDKRVCAIFRVLVVGPVRVRNYLVRRSGHNVSVF